MAKFQFTLQPVLNMREREERSQQRVVAEIQRARVALEDRIRRFHAHIEDERRMLREQLVGSADLPGARRQANATVFLAHQADASVLELAGVYARLNAAKRDLARATGRRRAIELLREQQQDAWQRSVNQKEQQELDEVAASRCSVRSHTTTEYQR